MLHFFHKKQLFYVELDDELPDDEFIADILVPLQNHDVYASSVDISLEKSTEDSWNAIYDTRVQQILNVVKESKFFVKVDFGLVSISGKFLAGWIRTNKTTTDVTLSLNNVEGIQDLSSAIENDTTITSLTIFNIDLDDDALQKLCAAFRRNKSIQSLTVDCFVSDKQKIIFEHWIALNKYIKHLHVEPFAKGDPNTLQVINNALKENTGLTSVHFELDSDNFDKIDPIKGGFVISNRIKKVEFTFNQISFQGGIAIENMLCKPVVESITNMTHVEHLRINFDRFKSLHGDLAKVLRESHACIQLNFYFCQSNFCQSKTDIKEFHNTIEEISSWKRQPQIEISRLYASTDDLQSVLQYDWKMVQKIRLIKLVIKDPTVYDCTNIITEIPNWKELEYLCFDFGLVYRYKNRSLATHLRYNLAEAVSDNYSIKTVDFGFSDILDVDQQCKKWLAQSLARNKYLSECRASNGILPNELIPALMEFADKNLDFLFDFVKAHVGKLFKSTNKNNKRKRCQMMSG